MLRVKPLRKELGISQKAVGDYLGISQQTVANIENEKYEPDIATLLRLADFFNCSLDYLLGRCDVRDFKNPQLRGADDGLNASAVIDEIEDFCRKLRKQTGKVNPSYKHHVLADDIFAALHGQSYLNNVLEDEAAIKRLIIDKLKNNY